MVRVVALHAHLERGEQGVADGTEEVRHELGRHLADELAVKLAVEGEVGAAAQVERDLGLGLIHRQHEAVAAHAALVTERLLERLAEGDADILDGVVLVDLEVAVALDAEPDGRVLRDLLEHVVKEADAGRELRGRRGVEVHRDSDLGFLGVAHDGGAARGIDELPGDFRPAEGLRVVADTANAEILREGDVGLAVADDGGLVARPSDVLHVIREQAELGLAAVTLVGGGVRADPHRLELDALRRQDVEQQLLQGAKLLLAETRGAEAVLVGDHDEGPAGVAQAEQRGHAVRLEHELVEAVDLLVERLGDERAIAINEQDFFHGA